MAPIDTLNQQAKSKNIQSLHDLEFDDFRDRRSTFRLLEALRPSRNRPLILANCAVLLHTERGILLLTARNGNISPEDIVICGWKDQTSNGEESYCLGIMDEQDTVAGAFYRCRRNPDRHRTLK